MLLHRIHFSSSLPSQMRRLSYSPLTHLLDFCNGVFLPPKAYNETAQRSRSGRNLKPTQKLKEKEWITVTGKGKRGRGQQGGRGPLH